MTETTRATGKWSQAGVPHRGWTCVDIDDLGEPSATCEMCETQEIRYVHRDLAARRRHMTTPRPSLPTALPDPPRTPAGKARLFDVRGRNPARHRLSAGGSEIRTLGPSRKEKIRKAERTKPAW